MNPLSRQWFFLGFHKKLAACLGKEKADRIWNEAGGELGRILASRPELKGHKGAMALPAVAATAAMFCWSIRRIDMVIREFGTENKRHLVFFQGSCEPWEEFRPAAEGLARAFHVLLVTPDGHDPQERNDFISVEKTVDDTVKWLKAHEIDRLDAMYGLSFGGGMVVRFLTTQEIPVDRAIIDAGTAPYQYPKWLCKLIGVRDFLMLKLARSSVKLMEAAFPPDRFARDPRNAAQEYEQIRQYLKGYSDKTIWNIFWSANNYEVPKTAPRLATRIQFWVGTEEWGSRFRDLKWTMGYLPGMEIVKIPGMMHGELVMMHPEKFTKQALAFLQ